eukprot:3901362-Pleurochrysis_carterae.AAC.2
MPSWRLLAERSKGSGERFLPVKFPQQPREQNIALFCEVVQGAVWWQLYQPLNDPKMNTVNSYQARSQRAKFHGELNQAQ